MLCTQVFLEGVKAALTADAKFNGGEYAPNDPPIVGLKACARVYAGRDTQSLHGAAMQRWDAGLEDCEFLCS